MSTDVYLLSSYKGWIMEAIARESADSISRSIKMRYLPFSRRDWLNLDTWLSRIRFRKPSLRVYMHHSTYLRHRTILRVQTRVFITHFDFDFTFTKLELAKLSKVDVFLVQNNEVKSYLVSCGLDSGKIEIVYGAISNEIYFPSTAFSKIRARQVLIVGDCKPRKNPVLIEEVIRNSPNFEFVIHGKNWDIYTSLTKDPPINFQLIEFSLSLNPQLMRESLTLLSLATLEGGPFPLLEALASGTPVVSTATGFAPDLIDCSNGVVLSRYPKFSEVTEALEKCQDLKLNCWDKDMTYSRFTWTALGKRLFE